MHNNWDTFGKRQQVCYDIRKMQEERYEQSPRSSFLTSTAHWCPLKEGIRPRTVEALQKRGRIGIKLCIATGRAPMEVPKFEGVTFDAFLTYNGSYCFTPERDVFKNLIPKADIALLRRNAEALGRPMALATKDRLAANGSDPDLAEYFAIGGVELVIADDFDAMAQGEIFQVLMSGREAEYPAILKDVENAKIAAWWDRAVDIIPASGRQGHRRGKDAGILRHRQVRQHGLR